MCFVTPACTTDRFPGRGRGTYCSPPAGVLLAIAVTGGGLAHEVFVGPIAAQAPIAAGTTVRDGLGREHTGGLGTGLGEGHSWPVGLSSRSPIHSSQPLPTAPGSLDHRPSAHMGGRAGSDLGSSKGFRN